KFQATLSRGDRVFGLFHSLLGSLGLRFRVGLGLFQSFIVRFGGSRLGGRFLLLFRFRKFALGLFERLLRGGEFLLRFLERLFAAGDILFSRFDGRVGQRLPRLCDADILLEPRQLLNLSRIVLEFGQFGSG